MKSDIPAYFATWSAEISSRASRVRLLIGSRHWLSDGTHKEFLVRDFLTRHLPPGLLVGRGFVRSLATEAVSREVDVLIADPVRHTPIFNEGGLLVVTPSSVVATIEVKSTYRKNVLTDALKNVLQVRFATGSAGSIRGIWSGIFFATSEEVGLKQMVREVGEVLQDSTNWKEVDATAVPQPESIQLLPAVICILDRYLILLDGESLSKKVRIRGFNCGETAAALALAQLFSFVRALMSNEANIGELDEMLEGLEDIDFQTTEVTIL